MKNTNSSVVDNISLKIIKLFVSPLAIIINQSIKLVIFPDKLKIAKVKPLYKKTLLPVISNIYEKFIHKQLIEYFTENNLISDC